MWWKRCEKTIKWCCNSISKKKINTLIAFNFCFNKRKLVKIKYSACQHLVIQQLGSCFFPYFSISPTHFLFTNSPFASFFNVYLFTCFIMTKLIFICVLINKFISSIYFFKQQTADHLSILFCQVIPY